MNPTTPTVAIIGAGFGGIAMAIKLEQAGVPFTILERGDRVGGVWRHNTYPGAACDIPSHLYSYSFEPNPFWSRRYGPQPEIQRYLEHCSRKYGVHEHVRFGSEVERAAFDETAGCWRLGLRNGSEVQAQFLVAATGQLSMPGQPRVPGLDNFEGKIFHSARWDHGYDLEGKRVAVVGTGASAIQFVPRIAPRVARMHVFQRSAPYVFPKADRPYTRLERRLYRLFPLLLEASRARQYAYHEARVLPLTRGHGLGLVHRVWKHYLRTQVTEQRLRELLTPNYQIGCKRVLISNDWYVTLTRPNVELIPAGITEVRQGRIVAANGAEREVDTIIFGTGFTTADFLTGMTIIGRDGNNLRETWRRRGGAEAYLGITVSGFPNLFILYGPNTNLGHNSIVYMLEGQADYALAAIRYALAHGARSLDVYSDVEDAYNRALAKDLRGTVWQAGCDSWYVTEAGKNTHNWPGFTFEYRRRTRHFDPANYEVRGSPRHESVSR